MIKITIEIHNAGPHTVWGKLAERLGREPTQAEAIAEVKRIFAEAREERAKAEKRARDLEAFRATKRRVADVQAEVGAVLYFNGEEGEPPVVPGLIYRDGLYIEERPNGQYYLILEREDWITSDLADLEEKLFDWANLNNC